MWELHYPLHLIGCGRPGGLFGSGSVPTSVWHLISQTPYAKLNETQLTAGYIDISIFAQVFEEMLIEVIVS
jgi:hypothetical protein